METSDMNNEHHEGTTLEYLGQLKLSAQKVAGHFLADELISLVTQLGIDVTRLTSLELAQITRKPSIDRYLIVAQNPSERDNETKIEKLEGDSYT